MPDEINFLPEKEKEEKEREATKKKSKEKVEFHNPVAEPKTETKSPGLFPTVRKFIDRYSTTLKAALTFKRAHPTAEQDAKGSTVSKTKINQLEIKKIIGEKMPGTKKSEAKPALKKTATEQSRPQAPGHLADLTGSYNEVDVNLMPWQDPSVRRNKYTRIMIILLSFVIVLVWGTVLRIANGSKAADIDNLERSIQTVDDQLNNINAELLAQGSLIAVRQREFFDLYTHIPRWSKFFTWLESQTRETVYFDRFSVQGDAVVLDVIAPDYLTAAEQWLTFKNATSWVEAVTVTDFEKNTKEDSEEEVSFSLDLDLLESAMYVTNDEF